MHIKILLYDTILKFVLKIFINVLNFFCISTDGSTAFVFISCILRSIP